MPTVDVGGCLSNYWFVWSINGLGSILSLAVTMAVSFFFLKYLPSSPSIPKKPKSDFAQYRSETSVAEIPDGSWTNEPMMGYAFYTARV